MCGGIYHSPIRLNGVVCTGPTLPLPHSLCFIIALTEHHAVKAYWGSGGIALRILDLSTRWR